MAGITSLPLFHRIAGQKVLVLGDGEIAEPKKRLVERAGGIVEDDMQRAIDEGIRLAFVAYEDPRACENAAINLRCAGMLVNVVDMPDLCDFTTPSILDRDPVLVAIGTGGASAGLAKHLRLRLERILPQSLGQLAESLFRARGKLRERYAEPAARRAALDEALREGGPLDALVPQPPGSVEQWIEDSGSLAAPRTETIVLASSDPEDLSIKHARWLGQADMVLIDGDVPDAILARARADAQRLPYSEKETAGATEGLTVILRYASPA